MTRRGFFARIAAAALAGVVIETAPTLWTPPPLILSRDAFSLVTEPYVPDPDGAYGWPIRHVSLEEFKKEWSKP